MIPFVLIGVGGYLLGSSKADQFKNGGMVEYFTFESEIESSDITIYNINDYLGIKKLVDVETSCNLKVEFHLTPDIRKWGLKGIDIAIENVSGNLYWEAYLEELTEEQIDKLIAKGGKKVGKKIEGEKSLSFKSYSDWTVTHDIEFSEYGSFRIDGANIDFKDKTLELLR